MAALRGIVLSQPEEAAAKVCQALASGNPVLESMALRLVPGLPGASSSRQIGQCLGAVSADVQPLLVGALALRRDAAARAVVAAAASSPSVPFRLAAIKALAVCGDESNVKLLVERVFAGPAAESELACGALARLRGQGIDAMLATMLRQGDAQAKAKLIRVLAARKAVAAVTELRKATEDPDGAVRIAAWRALGRVGAAGDAEKLLELLTRAGRTRRRGRADGGHGDEER